MTIFLSKEGVRCLGIFLNVILSIESEIQIPKTHIYTNTHLNFIGRICVQAGFTKNKTSTRKDDPEELPWVRWCSPRCSPGCTRTRGLWSASCPSGPLARSWPAAHACWGRSGRRTLCQRLLTTRGKGKGGGCQAWREERKTFPQIVNE